MADIDLLREQWRTGVHLIRAEPGLITRLAAALGISQSAVSMWWRVPAERVPKVEEITGIPRYVLRPDLWPAPGQRKTRALTQSDNISSTDEVA